MENPPRPRRRRVPHSHQPILPDPPDAPRIMVDALYLQPLGTITPEAAAREGCSSVDEFRDLWIRLHGSWEPNREVYVVRFHLINDSKKSE